MTWYKRSNHQPDPIQGSETELVAMTSDLADAHHDTLPRMHESLAAWRDEGVSIDGGIVGLTAASASRRGFLLGTGAILGGIAIATAMPKLAGASVGGPSVDIPRGMGGSKLTGDLAVVALAASLENLAVATYQGAIDAATAGKLGAVPPAVVEFATTAQSQHRDHAAAWNGVLESAGEDPVTGVDLTVKEKVVDPAFAKVSDVGGVAKLAIDLENSAAATYLAAIDVVKSPAGVQTAATIQPVELQHAAILYFVLGQYPVPETFASTTGARSVKDRIG